MNFYLALELEQFESDYLDKLASPSNMANNPYNSGSIFLTIMIVVLESWYHMKVINDIANEHGQVANK